MTNMTLAQGRRKVFCGGWAKASVIACTHGRERKLVELQAHFVQKVKPQQEKAKGEADADSCTRNTMVINHWRGEHHRPSPCISKAEADVRWRMAGMSSSIGARTPRSLKYQAKAPMARTLPMKKYKLLEVAPDAVPSETLL